MEINEHIKSKHHQKANVRGMVDRFFDLVGPPLRPEAKSQGNLELQKVGNKNDGKIPHANFGGNGVHVDECNCLELGPPLADEDGRLAQDVEDILEGSRRDVIDGHIPAQFIDAGVEVQAEGGAHVGPLGAVRHFYLFAQLPHGCVLIIFTNRGV